MILNDLLKLLVAVVFSIVGGAWVYMLWCMKQLTKQYKIRAQAATENLRWHQEGFTVLDQQYRVTHDTINIWERSLNEMRRQLKQKGKDLDDVTFERAQLLEKVEEASSALEQLRQTNDPLRLLIAKITAYPPLET